MEKLYNWFLVAQSGILGDCKSLGLPRCTEDGQVVDASGQEPVQQLLSIVFLAAGGVSILFILIGAGQLASAAGDPAGIKKGRDTILYAVIGLVVSLAAFSFITFVVGSTQS